MSYFNKSNEAKKKLILDENFKALRKKIRVVFNNDVNLFETNNKKRREN